MEPFKLIHVYDLDLRRPFKALSVHLQIKGVSEDLTSILNAYGLTIAGNLIKTQSQVPGQHKLEALRLFMTSLEVHMKWPKAICSIYQTNELRKLINEKYEARPLMNDSGLWIDDSVTFYLREMGFKISSNYLSSDEIVKLHFDQLRDVLVNKRITA